MVGHAASRLLHKLNSRYPLDDEAERAIRDLPITGRRAEISELIVCEGETPEFCCFSVDAFVYRQKLTGSGTRQILSIHIPGDILDFSNLFLRLSDHNVQMMTSGSIAFVPRENFRQLALQSDALARAMWVDTLIESAIFREWILNVGRRDARGRIAHLLCELAVRFRAAGLASPDGDVYELPMNQEEIGDAVGLTPVHVNRTLRQLTDDGLIERKRRFITIRNWDRLVAAADFSESYLHLDQAVRT